MDEHRPETCLNCGRSPEQNMPTVLWTEELGYMRRRSTKSARNTDSNRRKCVLNFPSLSIITPPTTTNKEISAEAHEEGPLPKAPDKEDPKWRQLGYEYTYV